MSDTAEQQVLIDFLEEERTRRHLEVAEYASLIGLSSNQYYNLRAGKKSGPQMCIDLARRLNVTPNYLLFLGGYIEEHELDAPDDIPAELLPSLQELARMRGTPFFDTGINMVKDVIERIVKLFKVAA